MKNSELKTSESGKHFFNPKASNGQVIGTSPMLDTIELRDEWMKSLKSKVPAAEILETKN